MMMDLGTWEPPCPADWQRPACFCSAFKQRVGAPGRMLWLRWDPEPALAESDGRGGSRDRCSLALRFQLPFCRSARRCFKNKQKEEGRAGWAACTQSSGRAGSRQQGLDVTEGTGSRSDLQSGACSVGVRDGQSCESPLYTPDMGRTIPNPLCRGIVSFSGCALGWGQLSSCFPRPQADSDLLCRNTAWNVCSLPLSFHQKSCS